MRITVTVQVGDQDPITISIDSEEDTPGAAIRETEIKARRPGRREQLVLDAISGWDGNWEVTEIARKSGVTVTGTYTSCHSLEKRGLIERTGSNPQTYRLIKPGNDGEM